MNGFFRFDIPADLRTYSEYRAAFKNLYVKALIIIGLPIVAFFCFYNLSLSRYATSSILGVMLILLGAFLSRSIKQREVREKDIFQGVLIRVFLVLFLAYLLDEIWVEKSFNKTPWFLLFSVLIFFSTNIWEGIIWSFLVAAVLSQFLFTAERSIPPEEAFQLKSRLFLVFCILSCISFVASAIFRSGIMRLLSKQKELFESNEALTKEIAERKRTEEALRESEEQYRSLVENAMDGCFVSEVPSGRFLFLNQRVFGLYGYTMEDGLKLTLWDLVGPSEHNMIRNLIKAGSDDNLAGCASNTYSAVRKDRSAFRAELLTCPITYQGKPCIHGVLRDVTEQERVEEQVRQTHKMEAIGTLAGGIAHEFNNILAVVLGNAELALIDTPEWSPARGKLKEIEKASLRTRDVVKQLLSFSRKAEVKRKPINASSILKESLKLVRASIPSSVEIRQTIQDDTYPILADSTQLTQVLINLSKNASDSMEGVGILEVTLRDVELEKGSNDMPAGKYVKLTVSDTGEGIAPELLNRVFEPYFTTKEVGRGTGLGLAVVHGIVQSHKGKITVDSEPRKGTTFNVIFPAIEEEPMKEADAQEVFPMGNERILVIDDEESIVQIAKQALERLEYEVEVRTDPQDAIALFRASPERFDLVITDTTMPKMTGDKVARELMKIRKDVRIVICTGFSDRVDEEKAREMGVHAYMMKPFDLSTLAHTVRKVLDGK
jgi:two-component system, cell cycle sensor histidine kinase and response regulator CckA